MYLCERHADPIYPIGPSYMYFSPGLTFVYFEVISLAGKIAAHSTCIESAYRRRALQHAGRTHTEGMCQQLLICPDINDFTLQKSPHLPVPGDKSVPNT